MEIDLIFKIAAIGIIISILNQVLTRSGREEQATMTTLAGLIVASIMYFCYELCLVIGYHGNWIGSNVFDILLLIFILGFQLSINLTVFLFIPLPGFDGYRLIANFLPYRHYRKLYEIEKYSLYIFLAFIILLEVPAVANFLIYTPANFLTSIIAKPWNLLFSLFV